MKKFTIVLALISLTACTAPDSATKALRAAGYTDIVITGHRFFMCGDRDTFSTGFKAKGPTGVFVTGAVCSGLLKGNTIRLD